MSSLVERLFENDSLEPVHEAKDGVRPETGESAELIELDPEDLPGWEAILEQARQDVELRGGLADLPCSADDDDRSELGAKPRLDLPDQVTTVRGQ
jgi:hypothetical protein